MMNRGFSLLEVMIALNIFAVFITAYVGSEGYLKVDSTNLREETTLKNLAQEVMADLELNPPGFSESLTLKPEVKNFEDDDLKSYEYEIEWKKLVIPNLAKVQGQAEPENQSEEQKSSYTDRIFEEIKSFIERRIWQAKVTVRNKETGFFFVLTKWFSDEGASVSINF